MTISRAFEGGKRAPDAVAQVDSISQLPPATGSGRKVSVTGYHAGATVGGGEMVDVGLARHNGGTLIDPNRSGEIGTEAYYVDSGVDANCFARTSVEFATSEMFGAIGDGVANDTASLNALDSLTLKKKLTSNSYFCTSDLVSNFYSDLNVTIVGGGSVKCINSSALISQRFAPSLPTLSQSEKLIITTDADGFYIATKKAMGKNGWILLRVGHEVSPTDAENTGGDSNFRTQQCYDVSKCWMAKTSYNSKTAGTVLSGLVDSQINIFWGYALGGGSVLIESDIDSPPYTWNSRECYNLSAASESITYEVADRKASIRFGMTNGSSQVVKIEVSANGTDFIEYDTISLKQPPSGTIARRDYDVEFGSAGAWFLRITNETALGEPCYVVGLNVGFLAQSAGNDLDSTLLIQPPSVDGVPPAYQGGGGANEFAARPTSGKWFGTYHGGHSNFLERLRVNIGDSIGTYDIRAVPTPSLLLTKFVHLHSTSTLTSDDGSVYQFNAETQYGDGAYVCSYSIDHQSGTPENLTNLYTHMCTTQRNFNYVHLPKNFAKSDDGNVALGPCSFIQQYRSGDGAHINCYFSEVDCTQNAYGGARIDFVPNFNKQYYGPAASSSSGVLLTSGQWITAKEYF